MSKILYPDSICHVEISISEASARKKVLGKRMPGNIMGLKPIKFGYGACTLCNCSGYISRNDGSHTCKVCKHHKSKHED